MCGIVGIVSNRAVNTDLYDALTVLQHRGQDAAGLMTSDGEKFHIRRGNGLVRDVVFERHMRYLTGSIGIGHVRYPTAGSLSALEAQPFYTKSRGSRLASSTSTRLPTRSSSRRLPESAP